MSKSNLRSRGSPTPPNRAKRIDKRRRRLLQGIGATAGAATVGVGGRPAARYLGAQTTDGTARAVAPAVVGVAIAATAAGVTSAGIAAYSASKLGLIGDEDANEGVDYSDGDDSVEDGDSGGENDAVAWDTWLDCYNVFSNYDNYYQQRLLDGVSNNAKLAEQNARNFGVGEGLTSLDQGGTLSDAKTQATQKVAEYYKSMQKTMANDMETIVTKRGGAINAIDVDSSTSNNVIGASDDVTNEVYQWSNIPDGFDVAEFPDYIKEGENGEILIEYELVDSSTITKRTAVAFNTATGADYMYAFDAAGRTGGINGASFYVNDPNSDESASVNLDKWSGVWTHINNEFTTINSDVQAQVEELYNNNIGLEEWLDPTVGVDADPDDIENLMAGNAYSYMEGPDEGTIVTIASVTTDDSGNKTAGEEVGEGELLSNEPPSTTNDNGDPAWKTSEPYPSEGRHIIDSSVKSIKELAGDEFIITDMKEEFVNEDGEVDTRDTSEKGHESTDLKVTNNEKVTETTKIIEERYEHVKERIIREESGGGFFGSGMLGVGALAVAAAVVWQRISGGGGGGGSRRGGGGGGGGRRRSW